MGSLRGVRGGEGGGGGGASWRGLGGIFEEPGVWLGFFLIGLF